MRFTRINRRFTTGGRVGRTGHQRTAEVSVQWEAMQRECKASRRHETQRKQDVIIDEGSLTCNQLEPEQRQVSTFWVDWMFYLNACMFCFLIFLKSAIIRDAGLLTSASEIHLFSLASGTKWEAYCTCALCVQYILLLLLSPIFMSSMMLLYSTLVTFRLLYK